MRDSTEYEAYEKLYRLAIEFLRDRGESGVDSLVELMAIFQICPMIGEETVEEQINHFAQCGRCIEYLKRHDRWWREDINANQWYPWPFGSVPIEPLHPLLRGFVERARGSELEFTLRRSISRYEREWLIHFIHRYGRAFGEEFGLYLQEIRRCEPELIQDYERYREGNKSRPPREITDSIDEGTLPLGRDESTEQAAGRLVASVRAAVEDGAYDTLIANDRHFAACLFTVIAPAEDVSQTLEFLNWLRKCEPGLRIQGNIPANEFADLALQFCEEMGYSNGRSFSEEARQWVGGGGKPRVIERIARFLKLNRRFGSSNGETEPRSPLDRYGGVRFHGIFLFMSSGDFPTFINTHWRDLHHLTGDYLDIYYSQRDLEERTSGYEIVNEFKSVSLRVVSLPALFLWEDVLENGEVIPLYALDHAQVMEVVKSVVQGITDGCALKGVTARANERAEALREPAVKSFVGEIKTFLIIRNEGVMGDVYNNNGIAGAMGRNANSDHNVFSQDAIIYSEIALNANDISVIEQLAEALASRPIEGIELSVRLEGAQHLATLAKDVKAGEMCETSLARWKRWINDFGEQASKVLSGLAHIVTITKPVAELLGLPMG